MRTSRTWPTEPGAPVSSGACSVCTESITQTSGRSAAIVASTVSRSVSASTGTSSAPAPSRDARRRICAADSSPETYSVRRPDAWRLPSAMFVSVDLPMPGEPPSSTSEPGTRPPPRTRSNSPIPVRQPLDLRDLDVPQRDDPRGRTRPRDAARTARGLRGRGLLGERVPLAAAWALPVPLGLRVATGPTDADRLAPFAYRD